MPISFAVSSALSMIRRDMLVQVRWRHVVSSSCRWQTSASWRERTEEEPPADQVTVTKSGRRARAMRSRRAVRFWKPSSWDVSLELALENTSLIGDCTISVFGGKNSRLWKVAPGGRAAIFSVIFCMYRELTGRSEYGVD